MPHDYGMQGMAKYKWPCFNGSMNDATKVRPLALCHNDPMSQDRSPELQTVVDQHAELRRLEDATRAARLRLGDSLTAARAAGVTQKQLTEETGENRETLRRWERAAEEARRHDAAS